MDVQFDFFFLHRIILLGLAFVVVPFLPACNLFFRVGFVVAERVLYLSSAGFCMLVLVGIRQLSRHYLQVFFII